MALTPTQEAQVLQLIAEQAALLSLADNEATIISKLGATKVNLSSLGSAVTFDDADIMLIRQGTTDLSIAGSIVKTAAVAAVPDASETVKGKVELATSSETITGTDNTRAVHPAGLTARTATETRTGIAEVATQAETDAGTDDARMVTPKKLRWGFSALLSVNGYIVLPTWLGGIVIQWGRFISSSSAGAAVAVAFPVAFPTNVVGLTLTGTSTGTSTTSAWFDTPTPTGFNGHSNLVSVNVFWIAIGF